MNTFLDLTNGVCWTLVYLIAVVLGFRNKTWYIPKLAICQNFTWELFAVIERIQNESFGLPFWIQFVWLLFDVIILLNWLIYDHRKSCPWIWNLGLLFFVAITMYIFTSYLGQWEVAAFFINAVMSFAFIVTYYFSDSQGKTVWIAVLKLIGTLAATILNGLIISNLVVLWLGGVCLLLDSYYVLLFINKKMADDAYEQCN